MQDLRLVLIILGVIAIAVLVIHGFWSNKKNQVKPLDDKPLNKVDHTAKDSQGFDSDGIGSKRVIKVSEPSSKAEFSKVDVATDKIEPQFDSSFGEVDKSSVVDDLSDNAVPEVSIAIDNTDKVLEQVSAGEDKHETIKSDDLVVTTAKTEPVLASGDQQNAEPQSVNQSSEEQVFVLNVMAAEDKPINGAVLLQELLTLGFKFGEMDIFHRHVDSAGKGPVIFSLTNIVKPGTFDIDNMEQFQTPGVSLFMMYPCANQASVNYAMMLNAAEHLAQAVNGAVFNGAREQLTADMIAEDKACIVRLEQMALQKQSMQKQQ